MRQVYPPLEPMDSEEFLQKFYTLHMAYKIREWKGLTVEDIRLPASVRQQAINYALAHTDTVFFLNRHHAKL